MKIRLPVIVQGEGEWACHADHHNDDRGNLISTWEVLDANFLSSIYWIEIDLPAPQAREIKVEASLKGDEGAVVNLVAVEVT